MKQPVPESIRCGYAVPTDDGAIRCPEIGLRITVREPLGHLMSIIRCQRHSDWINHDDGYQPKLEVPREER